MVSSARPRTPNSSASPQQEKLPPIPENKSNPPRRSSLGFMLRRTKSGDLGPKGGKKYQAHMREQELLRQQREASIPKNPPSLPVLYNGAAPPELQSFGGDDRPDSVSIISGRSPNSHYSRGSTDPAPGTAVPLPPVPGSATRNGDWVDPYARTESMTHRGRYSYASSAISTINSPRRVRRRKDPTPFNILIIGARNSGKTSFLNFLKTSLALPAKKRGTRPFDPAEDANNAQQQQVGNFISHYLETEIDGERIGLTLWDSEGLEANVVDLQLREMASFLESKFEETFTEEMKVVRSPGVQDTHIHCAFLVLDPARLDKNLAALKEIASNGVNGKYKSHPRLIGGLDEDLDLSVLRTLQGKTTVVPVISKADTITTAHMSVLKRTVWDSLRKTNLDPLEALGLDDTDGDATTDPDRIEEGDEGEEGAENHTTEGEVSENLPIQNPDASVPPHSPTLRQHKRSLSTEGPSRSDEVPYLPLSIISPDIYEPGVIGRKFPWGFADPYNVEHCDFVRLKEAVFSEWRGELREASREVWYEGWRTSRLKHRDVKKR